MLIDVVLRMLSINAVVLRTLGNSVLITGFQGKSHVDPAKLIRWVQRKGWSASRSVHFLCLQELLYGLKKSSTLEEKFNNIIKVLRRNDLRALLNMTDRRYFNTNSWISLLFALLVSDNYLPPLKKIPNIHASDKPPKRAKRAFLICVSVFEADMATTNCVSYPWNNHLQ